MNILKNPLTVGSIDITGILTDRSEAVKFFNERCIYSDICRIKADPYLTTIYLDPSIRSDGFECILGLDECYVVFHTRNCADNVGREQVQGIMQCVFDDPDITITTAR